MNIAIIVVLLIGLMASGLYIGLALAGVGVVGLELLRGLGTAVSACLYNCLNNFALAAIPLFLLMGELVMQSGLSARLYKAVSRWTSALPGGLLHSNIVACAIFAAVSGSSPATAATIGTVAYSEQSNRGYNRQIIVGSLAAGGTLGILIPPSITMIIYGSFVGASVGRLFAGGIIPGIILALMFMCYIGFASVRNKSLAPRHGQIRWHFSEVIVTLKDMLPMLLIIVLIMGSIYGGVMTPTEAAAASAFLALVLGRLFGKINFTIMRNSAVAALRTTSMIFLIFIGASLLGSAMGLLRIPRELGEIIIGLDLNPMGFWFAIIVMYLILGCFMNAMAMMLITLPVVYPILVGSFGFDPIWFGVELVILVEIGMITPPVGLNLFVIQGIAKDVSFGTIVRGVVPFFVCMLLVVGLLTYVPDLVLFLPKHMIG